MSAKRTRTTVAKTRGRQPPKNEKASSQLQKLRAKTWAFMAAISISLSDDQMIAATRDYRRLVDRARKALFDLHTVLSQTARHSKTSPRARRRSNAEVEGLVSRTMILWRACGRKAGMPQLVGISDAKRKLQAMVPRSIAGEICFIRGRSTGMAVLIGVEDLLGILSVATDSRATLEDLGKGKAVQPILRKAVSVFGDEAAAERWLNEPAMGLDYQIPAKLLTSKAGAKLVDEFLTRLDYGVYT